MNVFVTGHRGYIGAVLVEVLKEAGHRVTGCDLGLFDGCEWEPRVAPDVELIKDVRRLAVEDLEGHDCVMHLAAISNDPMGELQPELTLGINRDGTVTLARLAKRAGVGRFLFSSSCSVYGQGGKLDLAESDALAPLTAYARSKIEAEDVMRDLSEDGFAAAFLRNATAFGHSPMLRLDLVANNLLACAHATGEIRIMSDGSPWRPLIHCRDIARAFLAFAEAPAETIRGRAVNVGANNQNYRVRDVADEVQRLIPDARISYTGEVGADPRNYRVAFDLLGRLLPAFRLEYDLPAGLQDLHRRFRDRGLSAEDFRGDRFVRLRTLKQRLRMLSAA
jgi:nucleoside-diphosphate-sugar epimerase